MLFCASWENDSTEGNYVAFYQKATSERLELALIQHKWENRRTLHLMVEYSEFMLKA